MYQCDVMLKFLSVPQPGSPGCAFRSLLVVYLLVFLCVNSISLVAAGKQWHALAIANGLWEMRCSISGGGVEMSSWFGLKTCCFITRKTVRIFETATLCIHQSEYELLGVTVLLQ